jgi:hypothetical protein
LGLSLRYGLALRLHATLATSSAASSTAPVKASAGEKNRKGANSRPPPLTLLPETIDDLHHFLPAQRRVDVAVPHAHADPLFGVGHQQAPKQQVLHEQADEDAAVAAVLLLGRVVHVDEAEGLAEQLGHLLGDGAALELVDGGQAVVVEGDAVEHADEQQRPVRAALGLLDVAAVVDRQEDVRRRAEVRQYVFQRQWVRRVHQHERHAGAQQRDGCLRVGFELLMLEVSRESRKSAVLASWAGSVEAEEEQEGSVGAALLFPKYYGLQALRSARLN